MMIRNRYDFKWNCFYRCDHGDEEAIELMGRAGCEGVFLGVESGSDSMLELMNKSARRSDYIKAMPLLKAAGISTYASLIIGFPGETFETVQETIDFLEESKPDFYRAQLWYADPVTPIWEKREEFAITGSAFNWSHRTMDSDTACDLIDRTFLCVENSTWLPQFGFEQWSTFYLMRRGMTMEQIRDFLSLFNACIKERLLSPSVNTISPRLLDALKASCKFKEDLAVDLDVLAPLSPTAYLAAEEFWAAEFEESPPPAKFALAQQETPGEFDPAQASRLCVPRERIEECLADGSSDIGSLLLAVCAVLLSRLSGAEDLALAAGLSHGDKQLAVPLRLKPSWNMRLKDFVREVDRKLACAEQHSDYGFHVVTNRFRMARRNLRPPAFSFGFDYKDQAGCISSEGLDGTLDSYPTVAENLGLILRLTLSDKQIDVRFEQKSGHFNSEVTEILNTYLSAILNEVARNTEILIGEIPLGNRLRDTGSDVGAHASEVFSF
jgi:Radical SAM superfamily/Condensation domain